MPVYGCMMMSSVALTVVLFTIQETEMLSFGTWSFWAQCIDEEAKELGRFNELSSTALLSWRRDEVRVNATTAATICWESISIEGNVGNCYPK